MITSIMDCKCVMAIIRASTSKALSYETCN